MHETRYCAFASRLSTNYSDAKRRLDHTRYIQRQGDEEDPEIVVPTSPSFFDSFKMNLSSDMLVTIYL